MTTKKPFEFTDLVKRLDPAAITEQYKELLGKLRLPNLDTTALIETQSKNVQVLTDANWAILESTQSLFQGQTEMVKQVILGFRRASCERDAVAVGFTAAGDRAYCTGGNTKEYAEYYAGNPQEYKQYMRLFNDMIDAILRCDKPVVNRVQKANADHYCSDCPMAGHQIENGLDNGKQPEHPLKLLRMAYGI